MTTLGARMFDTYFLYKLFAKNLCIHALNRANIPAGLTDGTRLSNSMYFGGMIDAAEGI